MSVTAKPLINTKFATGANEYTAPVSTRTIVDKFTAYNSDATDRTLTIHIVPSGGSAGAANIIVNAQTIVTGTSVDFPIMQNQILATGDVIRVVPSTTGVISIRCSGREIV